ncbi:MAG: 3-oxoacyl-ACP synthase [Bacteroidia bacterium]
MKPTLKARIHTQCLQILAEKIERLQRSIADAQKAASEDTKSSAGDKFETSREMLKQEINKHSQQLAMASKMRQQFTKLNPTQNLTSIGFGSLVDTNEGLYYFSASLGKVELEDKSCFALSMISPIGKALASLKVGDEVDFMKRKIKILSVS